MLRGRKYLPFTLAVIGIHLPCPLRYRRSPLPSTPCTPRRRRHHPINGWIDRYPNVTRQLHGGRVQKTKSERPYWVVGSRAYTETTLSCHPARSTHTHTGDVGVCSCTCTNTHARNQTRRRALRCTRGNIITSVVCFPLIAIIGGT